MKLIANIVWFLFGGLASAILWCLGGIVCCITIVGIPLGVQFFKFAKLSLAPFGKKVKLHYGKHFILNTIWLPVGLVMMFIYWAAGLISCVTIVGIPAGLQAFKFSKLALAPFGAEVTKK